MRLPSLVAVAYPTPLSQSPTVRGTYKSSRSQNARLSERGRLFRSRLLNFVRDRGQKWLKEQEGSYTPSIGKVDEAVEPESPGGKMCFDQRLPTPPPSRSASFDAGGERRKQVRNRCMSTHANIYPAANNKHTPWRVCRPRQSSFKGARLESGVAVTDDPGSFPLKIMCSTMPRAYETADLEDFRRCEQFSNLNPLDKGDFTGLEMGEIRETDPEWYARLQSDPFQTRFPGGESYKDLIQRLESCLIDMEQQVRVPRGRRE